MTNFNAIQYSDGKLWAYDPITKARVEFKPEQFYQIYGALSVSVKMDFIKEGEVYPKPEGYRIGIDCNADCPDARYGNCCHPDSCKEIKKFALLLPIREEPTVTLPNVKNDPLYQDLNRLPAIHEQINKTSKEIWEDQPAKPSPEIACIATDEALPTRKLVLDELIEFLNLWKTYSDLDEELKQETLIRSRSLRKKEEENERRNNKMKELLVEIYQSPTANWWMKYEINKRFPELVQMLNQKPHPNV